MTELFCLKCGESINILDSSDILICKSCETKFFLEINDYIDEDGGENYYYSLEYYKE